MKNLLILDVCVWAANSKTYASPYTRTTTDYIVRNVQISFQNASWLLSSCDYFLRKFACDRVYYGLSMVYGLI